MSDTETFVYRYSWDSDDLQTYPWSHHYIKQPDVLAYLEHVVARHDLRKYMQFNTELLSADWSDDDKVWKVNVSTGTTFRVKYLVTAMGILSRKNYPDIAGIDSFTGTKCHTAAWDPSIELKDKRVGVIGCGSTGVQVITAIAQTVSQLVCFQRHPQYSVPSGDGPVTPEYRQMVNGNYGKIVDQVKNSLYGFGFEESERSFDSFSPEEQQQVFEELWEKGNGFRFLSGGFSDVSVGELHRHGSCTRPCRIPERTMLTRIHRWPPTGPPTRQLAPSLGARLRKSSRTRKRHGYCSLTTPTPAGPSATEATTSSLIGTTSPSWT